MLDRIRMIWVVRFLRIILNLLLLWLKSQRLIDIELQCSIFWYLNIPLIPHSIVWFVHFWTVHIKFLKSYMAFLLIFFSFQKNDAQCQYNETNRKDNYWDNQKIECLLFINLIIENRRHKWWVHLPDSYLKKSVCLIYIVAHIVNCVVVLKKLFS